MGGVLAGEMGEGWWGPGMGEGGWGPGRGDG